MNKCTECGHILEPKEIAESAIIEDKKVGMYKQYIYTCPECKLEYEIETAENRHLRNEFWRKYFGYLSFDEIRVIPRKLRVSRKKVIEVLGLEGKGPLGDKTLWDDYLQTEEEDELLRKAQSRKWFKRKMEGSL